MNYYNEIDKHAAAWLRELIKAGLIPPGDVDERSICEVDPRELVRYRQCHFFAGIGGWPLAFILARISPDEEWWSGSCPCQPFSAAGKQLAEADERHLWPVFFSLIQRVNELRRQAGLGPLPRIIGEQVASPLGRLWLAGIRADLEGIAYEVGAADLCAASVGAPHIRQRLFWMAHANGALIQRQSSAGDESLHREVQGPCERMADAASEQAHAADARGLHAEPCGRSGDSDSGLEKSGPQQPGRSIPGPGKGVEAVAERPPDQLGGSSCARDGWMGEPIQQGLEGHARHGHGGSEPGRLDPQAAGSTTQAINLGYWRAFDLIPCRDRKARRIEPGTFPLAHGIPARVVRLRGFGNAIVPEVAAEFIQASLEAIEGQKGAEGEGSE